MNRRPRKALVSVGPVLALTAVLLTGCPKTPVLAPGASGAGSTVGGAASAAGAGGPRGGTSGAGGGAGGAMNAASRAGGTAAATPSPVRGGSVPAALPSPKEFVEATALRDVHFDFDKYATRAEDVPILEADARWLTSNAHALLLIEGHADERGTNEYNLALGDRRAKATRDYLMSLGVEPSRITTVSYGEERPLCIERTEACWAQNRRGHFLVKP